MSKIGRQPIPMRDVKVELKGQEVHYAGQFASGMHLLPLTLSARIENATLCIEAQNDSRDVRQVWGLHRALLANKISGAHALFQKQVKIVGLGYKAIAQGANNIEFSLGYSHKINFSLPAGVTVEIDKVGQLLTLKSADKELVGKVGGEMRLLRQVEPYKGTGVYLTTDIIIRKAGKAKSSS